MKALKTLLLLTSGVFAMEYVALPVTDNAAFNYFFSLPFWLFVIESGFILGMSVFTYLKDQL